MNIIPLFRGQTNPRGIAIQIFEGQIRFGIHSGQQNTTFADYLNLWQTVEQLLPYVKLGVGDFIIGARAPADMETLELVAKKVAPLVKKEGKGILAAR